MRRSQVRFLSAPPSLRSWFYAKEGHTFVVSELRNAGHIGLFFRSAYLTPVGPSPNRGPWPRAGQFHRPRSLVMGSGAQTPDWVDGAIPEYFPASQFLPAHLVTAALPAIVVWREGLAVLQQPNPPERVARSRSIGPIPRVASRKSHIAPSHRES